MPFLIYCVTNSVNGKKYVGQTQRTLALRWAQHVGTARTGRGYALAAAILKYGADNFTQDILETLETLEACNAAERRWIHSLNCRVPHGYNLDSGGKECSRHPTTFKKMREAQQVRRADPDDRARTGRSSREAWAKHSPEQKARISTAWRAAWAQLSPEEQAHRTEALHTESACEKKQKALIKVWADRSIEDRAKVGGKISEGLLSAWAKIDVEERARRAACRLKAIAETPEWRAKLVSNCQKAREVWVAAALAKRAPCAICGSPATKNSSSHVRFGGGKRAYCEIHKGDQTAMLAYQQRRRKTRDERNTKQEKTSCNM